MMQKGQLSLEYLLLLLAAFSIFAILLPSLHQVYNASLFALDSTNAKHFSGQLEHSINKMLFLADGSIETIKATPFTAWQVSSQGEKLFVTVESLVPTKQKSFTISFPNEIELQQASFSSEKLFLISKRNGKILIEHN